jgi:transmembrane sensor
MSNSPTNRRHDRAIDDDAAAWVVRQERGLTAAEQDAFSQWLAADARHQAAFAEQRWSWEELDRLNGLQSSVGAVPDPKLLAPRQRIVARWTGFAIVPLVMAAAAAMMVYLAHRQPAGDPARVDFRAVPSLCEERKLSFRSRSLPPRGRCDWTAAKRISPWPTMQTVLLL